MPALTEDSIEDMFTYHPPRPDQIPQYEVIRAAAKVFALVVLKNTPASADQTAAIRLIRQAVWTANSSVSLDGRY